jgi:hypothetical protein
MIFSGQQNGQDTAGRTGQPASATVVAGTVSPVAGIAAGVTQAILTTKVATTIPSLLAGSPVAGTIAKAGGGATAPLAVAKPHVVGSWIGNKAAKPVANQVSVNKWQEGLVARSSDVAKSVGNQTGKGQNGVGQPGAAPNGKGPASRSSSSWW